MERNPVFILILFHDNERDASSKDEIVKHLHHLKSNGQINLWETGLVLPGQKTDKALEEKLSKADIILFLVSPDSMSSDKIWNDELKSALQRVNDGDLIFVPVIIRSYAWENTAIGEFAPLPKDGKPIKGSDSADEDALYQQVADGVRGWVEKLSRIIQNNNKQVGMVNPDFQEIEAIFQKSPDERVMKHEEFGNYDGKPLCTAHFAIYAKLLQEIRERLEKRNYDFYLGNIEDARIAEEIFKSIFNRTKEQGIDIFDLTSSSKILREKARSLKLTLIDPEFDKPENWPTARGQYILPFCKLLMEFEEKLAKLAVQSVKSGDFPEKFSSN